MALNIRDPEVRRLAREVAEMTGETMTNAVKQALRDRLDRLKAERKPGRGERAALLMEFGRRFSQLPVEDPRPVDEILDYDENGLPR